LVAAAKARVEAAVRYTLDEDLRADQALAEAAGIVSSAHPTGGRLAMCRRGREQSCLEALRLSDRG